MSFQLRLGSGVVARKAASSCAVGKAGAQPTRETVIAAADRSLYEAKEAGRDRVGEIVRMHKNGDLSIIAVDHCGEKGAVELRLLGHPLERVPTAEEIADFIRRSGS